MIDFLRRGGGWGGVGWVPLQFLWMGENHYYSPIPNRIITNSMYTYLQSATSYALDAFGNLGIFPKGCLANLVQELLPSFENLLNQVNTRLKKR